MTRRLALICAGGLALAGCVSMRPEMTRFAIDYNRVVADARNKMILLNIVRAAYREPTYYTAISQIEGSLSFSGKLSGGGSIVVGDNDTWSPSVEGSVTNAPTFTIVPLNTDEFAKGMLQTIDAGTIRLLLSQGWDSRMLAPLLIERIECQSPGGAPIQIENDPGHYPDATARIPGPGGPAADEPKWGALEDFRAVRFLDGISEKAAPFKLQVDETEAAKLLYQGLTEKFDVSEGSRTRLATGASQAELTISAAPEPPVVVQLPPALGDQCAPAPGAGPAKAFMALTKGAQQSDGGLKRKVILRSIDAVIYYLGEMVRHQPGDATAWGKGGILFRVEKDDRAPAVVDIKHRGVRWTIPEREGPVRDQSLQVLDLINQLIALQTSAKDFQRTPTSLRTR